MFFVIFCFLLFLSFLEITTDYNKNLIFNFAFIILTFLLCFRYGQGMDYFGYRFLYYHGDEHSEIGFIAIQNIFRALNLDFEVMIFFISAFQMLCIYRAIYLFSPYKVLSLCILYHTIYLTYFFSAIRQGIVISFFLGFMLKWLLEDRKFPYIISCLLMSLLHSASLVLILLVFIKHIKIKHLIRTVPIVAVIGLALSFLPPSILSFLRIGSVQSYLGDTSFSVIGIAERIFMFVAITLIFGFIYSTNKKDAEVYKYYSIGFIFSLLCLSWSLISSRLSAPIKAIEVLFIPFMLSKVSREERLKLFSIFALYIGVMTIKSVESLIQLTSADGYNFITYPYCSIFDRWLNDPYEIN